MGAYKSATPIYNRTAMNKSNDIFKRSDSLGMNQTSMSASEFVLLCTIDSQKKNYAIAILTMVYLVTLCGNFLVILVIAMHPHLQKPMYVGIATLAVIDLVGSTNITPKLIAVLLDWVAIPYGPCLLQLLLVLYLGAVESFLLAFMACDRYVAVVHPLRYSTLITKRTVWAASKIACNENPKYFVILSIASFVFGVFPIAFVLLSYARIAYAALKISSVDGKRKTLNTLSTFHYQVISQWPSYPLTQTMMPFFLDARFSLIEIKQALLSMTIGSTPGLDGSPPELLSAFWNLLSLPRFGMLRESISMGHFEMVMKTLRISLSLS
ncbi:olfactory receptor 2AG2-like [Polypterus senegalus]|uniref:olfactory receptor 2AG2-like n=1 Tax=Polypterus senegalus TaxID=55291 RepID=UPI0019629A0E|nr:olfactory receptor 2AG2-like [Polypterus senegalus]